MRTISKKQKFVAAFAAVTLAGTGTAFAYWTTTGMGDGTASVAEANGTLVLDAAPITGVKPGNSYEFDITAMNAGTTDLRVGTVKTVVSSTDVECQVLIESGSSGLSVADVDASGSTAEAEATTTIGTGTLVFANSAEVNQDDCKSAPLVLTFTTA